MTMQIELTTDIVTSIRWSDTAWEHWQQMLNACANVGAYYGETVATFQREQLLRCITQATLACGPCRVMKDGDGFLIVTDYITMGLVWSPDSDEGMLKRFKRRGIDADLVTPLDDTWPRTGEWSLHS